MDCLPGASNHSPRVLALPVEVSEGFLVASLVEVWLEALLEAPVRLEEASMASQEDSLEACPSGQALQVERVALASYRRAYRCRSSLVELAC